MSLSCNMHFNCKKLYHSLYSNHRHIIVCPLTTDTMVCASDAPVCLSNTDLKHISRTDREKYSDRRVIPHSMMVLYSKKMCRHLHIACRKDQRECQTRRFRVGGSLIVWLILVSCIYVQIEICLIPGPSTCLLVSHQRP